MGVVLLMRPRVVTAVELAWIEGCLVALLKLLLKRVIPLMRVIAASSLLLLLLLLVESLARMFGIIEVAPLSSTKLLLVVPVATTTSTLVTSSLIRTTLMASPLMASLVMTTSMGRKTLLLLVMRLLHGTSI